MMHPAGLEQRFLNPETGPAVKGPLILLAVPELKTGGTENQVILLASGLRQRGFDARILCLFQKGMLAAAAESRAVPVTSLDLPYGWNRNTLWRIYSWLKSERPAVFHSFLFGFDFFALAPARLAGVPVTLSARRGRALSHWNKKRHRWIEKLGNLFSDQVVANSLEGARWAMANEKISSAKVKTIYNGIETGRFENLSASAGLRREFGIPQNAPLIGTVANFSPEKGYDILLDAAKDVLKSWPGVWFLFVGGGPLLEVMKKKAAGLNRGNQIIFAGMRQDAVNLLACFDIFALSSILEACPNAILEAMALAKPIVASSTGGIPEEMIEPGREGLLVPSDNPLALSKALLELLQNPAKGCEFGQAAHTKVREKFSFEKMIGQYENLYRSLMGRRGISVPEGRAPDFSFRKSVETEV